MLLNRHLTIPFCAVVLAFVSGSVCFAQNKPTQLPRVAIEDDGSGAAWRALREAGALPIPVAVRVARELSEAGAALQSAGVDRAAGDNRRIPLWLAIPAPSSREALDAWRAALRPLIERAGGTLTIFEITVDSQPADVARFAAQLAATELRAGRTGAQLALGGPAMNDPARRAQVYTPDLAPYVDLLAVADGARAEAVAWLPQVDADARVAIRARRPPPGSDPSRVIIESVVDDMATRVVIESWDGASVPVASLKALSSLSTVASHEVTALDPQAVRLSLRVAGTDAPAELHSRLLFDTDTFSTFLVYSGLASEQPLSVSVRVPLAGTPAVIDLLSGAKIAAADYARDDATEQVTFSVPLTGRPTLIDFNEGASAVGEQSSVSAERQLSVAEIISRHRQQQLTQDRFVRSYIADAQVRFFFRPTITDPGYDMITENRYFVAEDGIEWEERSFAVNNRHWDSDNRPPVPMIQPEKAFALPLQLKFDEGYTYRLAGTARVDGYDCYEVRFDPVRDDPALYRGTVWIDRRTFARVRLQAVQGGLTGMVISNDETQHYAPVALADNQPVFLLNSLTSRQVMLVAGRNIPVEKSVTFAGFRVNDPNFTEARASARASDRIMYKETPNGLRSYVKRDNVRVVDDRLTQSVKAMALGVVVDPSYQFPLPIFGINYVDFNFGSSNTQLAMLFAGVLAAGNIQRPQLFGAKHLSASLDFFGIAAPSTDRIYESDAETESERLLTWPLTTGLNMGWQATPFQKFSFQYQFRFDGYVRDTTTSETFQVPSSTVTNGFGGAWEYSRGGYTLAVNGAWFRRLGWEPWGDPAGEGLVTTPSSYAKWTTSLSRDFLLNVFQKINVNAAWFSGRDLDRFVKYQFGLFDTTRIHGVPGAVRFGELAMVRGVYSVNVFDQYRLDLFLDHAWGRDEGDAWQRVPGVGAAFNLPGPWNTIVRADVGHSWLPGQYNSLGSTSVQVMLLKPLR